MKKILISLAVIGAVGAIAAGATGAFFSDTETSTGNTFTAGAIVRAALIQEDYPNALYSISEAPEYKPERSLHVGALRSRPSQFFLARSRSVWKHSPIRFLGDEFRNPKAFRLFEYLLSFLRDTRTNGGLRWQI